MASNAYQVNSAAGTNQNPFIKIIEQEFMHEIDKASVPAHVLNEAVQNTEPKPSIHVSDHEMDEVVEDAPFGEMGNQLREFINAGFQSPGTDTNTNWPHNAVNLLLDLYKKYLPKFNSKNIKKKGVWNLLSTEMKKNGHDLSGEACDKKFRALKHRYKIILENMQATGRRNRKWEYFDAMGKVLEDDPLFKVDNSSDESQEEEQPPDDDEDPNKNHFIWTHSRKLLLLKLCRDHSNDDRSTDVWKTIAEEMRANGCGLNADICEKKFRYFKYRYKKIMECDDPISEGNKWVYFEIMKSLLEGDSVFKFKANVLPAETAQLKIEAIAGTVVEGSEECGNNVEARGEFTDTYMMDEIEDAQGDTLAEAFVPTVWAHRAILMLIRLYKSHLSDFMSPSMKKSDVWKTLANKMQSMGHNYSAEACDKKFRCLKYRYSKIESCGRGRKWPYYQHMHSIFENQPDFKPIKIVSTMTLPPDEIEDHSSNTSPYGLRKRITPSVSAFKVRGASPIPRKKMKTNFYDDPPPWFLAFVESQNKHIEEVKALQKASLKVARERNTILKNFTDVLLKRMKSMK